MPHRLTEMNDDCIQYPPQGLGTQTKKKWNSSVNFDQNPKRKVDEEIKKVAYFGVTDFH